MFVTSQDHPVLGADMRQPLHIRRRRLEMSRRGVEPQRQISRSAFATSCLPKSRSKKEYWPVLGGDADVEFAPDRFLDVRLRAAIFLD